MLKKILQKRELFWTFLYQLTALLGGLVLIKLLSKILAVEVYGHYVLITSIVALIVMLPFSALMQGVNRYLSIYQIKNRYNKFFTTVVILHVAIVFLYIFSLMIVKLVVPLDGLWVDIYYLIAAFAISEIFKVLLRTINNANRERKNILQSTFLEFTLKIGLSYFAYSLALIDIRYLLFIYILANSLSVIVMLNKNKSAFQLNSINAKESKIIIIRIWAFSSPLIIWAVFGWLRDMSNRWYVDHFLDKEHVALFSMMASIAMIAPTALLGLVGGYYMPILYQKDNDDKGYIRRFLVKLLPVVALVFFLSIFITFIFKDYIVLIVSDEKYLKAAWMLPWMFIVFCIYTMSMMATYEIFAHKQTKRLIISNVLPGLISIVGGYILIKSHGIEGALYNYILTYLSYAVLTFYVVFKYSNENRITRI